MIRKYWQIGLNVFLCGFFLDFTVHQFHQSLTGESLRYGLDWYRIYWDFNWLNAEWARLRIVDWSFRLQNLVMCLFLLIRTFHRQVDKNVLHQLVALGAFFSGAFMMASGRQPEGFCLIAATVLVLAANLLGIVSLLSLNRSFGILIARRKIKTGGVYRLVRHPMYDSDMLLRIGFLTGYFSPLNLLLVMVSLSLYIIRARLEENFLLQNDEYRAYAEQVKWRFIPGVY